MFFHANNDVDDDDKVEGGCVDTDVQGILAVSEEPSRWAAWQNTGSGILSAFDFHRTHLVVMRMSEHDDDIGDGDGGAKNRLSPSYDSLIRLN